MLRSQLLCEARNEKAIVPKVYGTMHVSNSDYSSEGAIACSHGCKPVEIKYKQSLYLPTVVSGVARRATVSCVADVSCVTAGDRVQHSSQSDAVSIGRRSMEDGSVFKQNRKILCSSQILNH